MAKELIVQHGIIIKGTMKVPSLLSGILKTDGSGNVSIDSNTYLTTGTAASTYQPLDADLTAIAAIGTATGLLKKNGANTWAIDTTAYESTANKGVANGYVPLDGTAKIAATYLPSYVDDVLEYANLAGFPGSGTSGIIYVAIDTGKIYRWSGSAYIEISSGGVSTVNGQTGIVSLTTTDIPEGTNLYYTDERVDDRVAALVQNGTGLTWTYNDASGTFTGNVSLSTFSTTNLAEGSNLYFTTARVLNTAITGYSVGANTALAGTDTILGALQKVQGQLNNKQALSSDLTSIAALSGTGFLVKTGVSTWELQASPSVNTTDVTTNTLTVTSTSTLGGASAVVSSKVQALTTGSNVVLAVSKTTFKGLYIDYVIYNSTNSRAGQVTIINDGVSTDFNEFTTNDIGSLSTTDVDVAINGSNVEFKMINIPDNSYSAKIIYRYV